MGSIQFNHIARHAAQFVPRLIVCIAVLLFVSLQVRAQSKFTGPSNTEEQKTFEALLQITKTSQAGQNAKAFALAEKTCSRAQRSLGIGHPGTLTCQTTLGNILLLQGRISEAEKVLTNTYELSRRVPSDNDDVKLIAINNLVGLYMETGRLSEAEHLQRQALTITNVLLSPNHVYTLNIRHNLAGTLLDQRKFSEAKEIIEDVIGGRTKVMAPDHFETLTSMLMLAVIHHQLGQYPTATEILLSILDRAGPEPIYDTVKAAALGNLGETYRVTGRFQEAAALLEQQVFERVGRLGDDRHPDVVLAQNNLALVYVAMGRLREARDLLRHVFSVREEKLSTAHPLSLTTLNNLAAVEIRLGEITQAVKTLSQSVTVSRLWSGVEADAATGARGRKTAIELGDDAGRLAFDLAARSPSPQTAALAARVALNRKGLLGEREAALLRLARSSDDPDVSGIAAAYFEARKYLAIAYRRLLVPGSASNQAAIRQRFAVALKRVNEIERRLAQASDAYRTMREREVIGPKAIAAALDDTEALIEFVAYLPTPESKYDESGSRYGALVFRRGVSPRFTDLGPALPIATAVETLRSRLGTDSPGADAARDLFNALILPVEQQINGAKTLYIAPAGRLGFLPFELLVRPRGRRLANERLTVRYVSSGRAVVQLSAVKPSGGLVALGGIDYQKMADPPTAVRSATQPAPQQRVARLDVSERTVRSATALLPFAPLVHTEPEVSEVADIWHKARRGRINIRVGPSAHEAYVAEQKSPQVLHLATHGFVVDTQVADTGGRPALLSGIALAGANLALQSGDAQDGILFGYEIEQVDLSGTELVVVSACETALGKSDASEGVYSLARAFGIAGAGAVLVTLKPVADNIAKEFVTEFYRIWLATPGLAPAEALADVKRQWASGPMGRKRSAESWAPFIIIEHQRQH